MNITNLTLTQTLEALEKGEFTKEELNMAYLKRINSLNPKLNAFLEVNSKSDQIPAAIKSLISTEGFKTSTASKIVENYTPPFNATVIERLLQNGISVIGKTNQDEFATGSSGENSAFGPTKNPWDITKVPGGSSSGSAAAVVADMCVFALGTDTGGSIRQPASLCGVVGLKPSYGRVSRYGLIAMASSLDCPGPITKSAADARLVLNWIQGKDGYDSNTEIASSLKAPRNDVIASIAKQSLKGIKVGVPQEYFGKGLDGEVERVIKHAILKMQELGAEIVEVELPHTEYAVATYYLIMASEVSSNLARFDGIRFSGDRSLFGPEPKRRIMLGTFALSTGYFDDYFIKAAKVRTLIKKDFDEAFKKCDVIVGPVSPTVAWGIGEKVADPLAMYLMDVYTVPPSLAGIPGISVPCGFVKGLPVGLQILGPYMGDEVVLDVAEAYENNTNWSKAKPKL